MKKVLYLLLVAWIITGAVYGQALTSSSLPIFVIDTKGQTIPDEPKIVADLRILDNGPGKRNALADRPALITKIGIERRGATSQQFFPKKPYGIELRDSTGLSDVSLSVLGLPAEEDWVLNATYNDKTLLREVFTYDIYRRMSRLWTTGTRFCEVVLNGDYQGVYILMERAKRDRNRVNIASIRTSDNSGDALTGGYLLKIDKTEGAVSRFWTSPYPSAISNRPVVIQVDHPKIEDLTDAQFSYIRKYVTEVEEAFTAADYKDPQKGVRRYIDEESFIDFMLINEVCRNVDGYRLSTFFYKDRDSRGGKLTMGPIWDFNLAYGNADYCKGNSYEGWAYKFNSTCPTDGYQIPFWWNRLVTDAQFGRKMLDKYSNLRKTVLSAERLTAYIDSVAGVLREPRERNFQRWPVIGQKLWPNYFVGRTYDEEVNYLKTWLLNRLSWMDQNLPGLAQEVLATEPTVPAATLGNAAPNPYTRQLTVDYTLHKSGFVHLKLLDLRGRILFNREQGLLPSGHYQVQLDEQNAAAGLYWLLLEVDGVPSSRIRLIKN